MILIFERMSEYTKFDIDRRNKRFHFQGPSTNFKEEEMLWRHLWDKCELHKQDNKADNLDCKDCNNVANQQDREMEGYSDKKFMEVFVKQMQVYGFRLIRWEH